MVTKVLYTFERMWDTRLAPPTPLPTPRLFPPYPYSSPTPSPSPLTPLSPSKQLANKDVWLAAVRHSQNYEKGYWRSDNIHEPVGPVIINVASDNESEDDDDVFLDSDCE